MTIWPSQGSAVTDTTYSTSYTPTSTLDPDDGPFRWSVQAIALNGSMSPLVPAGQRGFSLSDPPTGGMTPPVPTAPVDGTHATRFPALAWTPVANADHYTVDIGVASTGFSTQLDDEFEYPNGTDTSDDWLQPGTYEWFVTARTSGGNPIATGPSSTFVVDDLPAVSGHSLALTGTGTTQPSTACSAAYPEVCANLRGTPVLDWDPLVEAGSYRVYLSRDRLFTNQVPGSPFTSGNTRFTTSALLADSQAGEAYYWAVRPCKTPRVCAPEPTLAGHAFDKRSLAVQGATPGVGLGGGPVPQVGNQVTFSWDDMLASNQAALDPTTQEPGRVEAESYRVQVSTSATFSPVLDTAVVDQTTYTAPGETYPDGTLYWRVQAVDGSGNSLSWSPTLRVQKLSDAPTPTAPTGGATLTATPVLAWDALASVQSYRVEVYANGDHTHAAANLALSATTDENAYAPTELFASADEPYVWRVRALDSDGNLGPWSVDRTFTVQGPAPQLVAPKAGAVQKPRYGLFTWQALPVAAEYEFQRRAPGDSTPVEEQTTTALAWAPDQAMERGKGSWRVIGIDADGNVIAASAWRSVRVKP